MAKYFVQIRFPNGEVGASVNRPHEIIEFFGFRDCTDCEYEVFAADIFGSPVRLFYEPATSAPFNFHRFINSATGEVEFEGFSTEH